MVSEVCVIRKSGILIVGMVGPWGVIANRQRIARRTIGRYAVVHLNEQYVESVHALYPDAEQRMVEVYNEDQEAAYDQVS